VSYYLAKELAIWSTQQNENWGINL
jgi:hypothetical protein